MFRCLIMAALAGLLALAACSPTLNWREVRSEATGLKALLPCKPDKATRTVAMGGRQLGLEAIGCEAGGATFAVMFADIGTGSAGEMLEQWKAATLAGLRGKDTREQPFRPPGAIALPQSLQVVAAGLRANGGRVQAQVAYFARGRHVFQAAIFTEELRPELTEPFFSGLSFE
jgi:hypothetical protein